MSAIQKRAPYFEPLWFREETKRLADKWIESGSELDIIEFINENCSERYKAEVKRSEKFFKSAS
ncbi:MAG: hypothetical protein J6S49_11005 [Erysipelotrichaceae bacterium]|nr:hypothetical protein [Erysipelotrichaceae bacterium]